MRTAVLIALCTLFSAAKFDKILSVEVFTESKACVKTGYCAAFGYHFFPKAGYRFAYGYNTNFPGKMERNVTVRKMKSGLEHREEGNWGICK